MTSSSASLPSASNAFASSSQRIENVFAMLQKQQQTGLISFIMACDPDYATCLKTLQALPDAGADIIELGMPFSDTMADGPAIQSAAERALTTGATLRKCLKLVEDFRENNQNTPIILMGYYNPIFHYGVADFCRDAKSAGVDGLIIVDVPYEEETELTPHLHGLHLIRLIAPTTTGERLPMLVKHATGFIYYISITGITGTASANVQSVAQAVTQIRQHSHTPVVAGFGVKTAEQAAALRGKVDAVVVGSALVEKIGKHQSQEALTLLREMKAQLQQPSEKTD